MLRFLAILTLVVASSVPANAVNPEEILDDPALEERAREISTKLRCLVCQNQSIDDSDADLARDLRVIVRERLVEGDSDTEVLDFVVDRYGEFVLLAPRVSARNLLLWATPVIVLVIGLVALLLVFRRRPAARANASLSQSEQERLSEILSDGDEHPR
ncbi:cytochrome c-type biogenesis protein [Oricola sp.]|uniref:cytochrome c-type biogenesis protein n=1 Tax=Oricola sp. TaxID=1979950 RepID=UPI003BACF603